MFACHKNIIASETICVGQIPAMYGTSLTFTIVAQTDKAILHKNLKV